MFFINYKMVVVLSVITVVLQCTYIRMLRIFINIGSEPMFQRHIQEVDTWRYEFHLFLTEIQVYKRQRK